MAYFVIEESSWAWDGQDPDAYLERIEQFLERLHIVRERDEGVRASREWLAQRISPDLDLAELLWDERSPLRVPRELREAITVCLGRMRYWDDDHPMEEFEATVAGEPRISPSAAHAHRRLGEGDTIACLALPGDLAGRLLVEVGGEDRLLFFVVDEGSHREFFRTAASEAKLDVARVATLAAHAYPDTYFYEDIWRDVRAFVGGYDAVRKPLLDFMAVFDDHGRWIFTDDSGRNRPSEPLRDGHGPIPLTRALIRTRFAAWGFDVAPEKPNVSQDRDCRRARERAIAGETVYCEWHLKLMGHQNRVHIHGPISATGDRVIVAIFCEHLPLP